MITIITTTTTILKGSDDGIRKKAQKFIFLSLILHIRFPPSFPSTISTQRSPFIRNRRGCVGVCNEEVTLSFLDGHNAMKTIRAEGGKRRVEPANNNIISSTFSSYQFLYFLKATKREKLVFPLLCLLFVLYNFHSAVSFPPRALLMQRKVFHIFIFVPCSPAIPSPFISCKGQDKTRAELAEDFVKKSR